MKNKHRFRYGLAVVATVGLGLLSRKSFIPDLIFPYLGDALYAVMFYFLVAVCFPDWSIRKKCILGVLICFGIEGSQLIQTEWLNNIRQTQMGGLILGFGFLWSDLLAYTFGGLIAESIDLKLISKKKVK